MNTNFKEALVSFQLARLIPTVADSKKEERATSVLLASFMAVPEFARSILEEAGAPSYKKMNVDTYTEVSFKSGNSKANPRPDGLIMLTAGKKRWSALVESKVGNKDIEQEQVEEYLAIAKQNGVDTVITISNQFATTPDHHPLKINKQKTRGVRLVHFSWLSILSKAILITDSRAIDDVEQAYILSELIRYFRHESSGITSMSRMENGWKEVYEQIHRKSPLSKSAPDVDSSVRSWLQLSKHLALKLSIAIGESVTIALPKKQANDPILNHEIHCEKLTKMHYLETDFEIPNAASRLKLMADFTRRTIDISMSLDAPKDRTRASAAINWFTRQLKGKKNIEDLIVRVDWPRRIPTTTATLVQSIEEPAVLIPEGTKELPSNVEVIRVIDLMSKFKGAKVFVEECTLHVSNFYDDVGQNLNKWVAKAPKVKKREEEEQKIPTVLSGAEEHLDADTSDPRGTTQEGLSEEMPSFIRRLIG